MQSPKELQWIEVGYQQVAQNGFKSINIESIARTIQKNKSSFYHYFGDVKLFETELLEFHIAQIEQFAQLAMACDKVRPDLLNLFVEHKTDLLFHKQLRINRNIPEYRKCFEEAFEKVETGIIDQWTDFLELNNQQFFAQAFLRLIAENFLLQITEQSFDYKWMDQYLKEVQEILNQMGTKSKK